MTVHSELLSSALTSIELSTSSPTTKYNELLHLLTNSSRKNTFEFTDSSLFGSLPFELLLLLFSNLDLVSLLRAKETCRKWNNIISESAEYLYRGLLYRDFGLTHKSGQQSFESAFRVAWNVHLERYSFSAMDGRARNHAAEKRIVAAWPVNPTAAYTVVSHNDMIYCAHQKRIKMYRVRTSGPEMFELVGEFPQIHGHNIGLILSNGKNLVITFDESSALHVWDCTRSSEPILVSSLFSEGYLLVFLT